MTSSDNTLMKFICPALAVVATIVALFGEWFTIEQFSDRKLSDTLLEVIQGDSIIQYSSSRWMWISAVGVVLVILSAVVPDTIRKKLAESGSYLMVILPAWSLFQVFVGDEEDLGAGWGMWAVTVLAIAVLVLARFIPEDESEQLTPVAQQFGEDAQR